MKTSLIMIAALYVAALSPNQSWADCLDPTGTAGQEAQKGISKDGTHAPLESGGVATQAQTGPAVGTTTTSADAAGHSPAKTGGQVPLAENPDVATSSQDAQAQQKGGKTAAAVANDKKC